MKNLIKKNHVWSGLMVTALVAGDVQAKGPMPNTDVIRTAASPCCTERGMENGNLRRNERTLTLLNELKIVLDSLQQHVVSMKQDSSGLAAHVAQVAQMKMALDSVGADMRGAAPPVNVWRRGPRRSGP